MSSGGKTVDFDKLKYFMRVAECEHITKAANDCYMTQPSLSRIITQLEAEVGSKLFDREGRSLKLNDSGRVVYDSAARILQELQDMQARLDDLSSGRAGQINFATTFPSYENDWIGSCTRAFLLDHPTTHFAQVMLTSYTARDALLSREVDIVISDQPINDSAIDYREIFSERLGIVLSRTHPLAAKSVLRVCDLAEYDFYCNNDNGRGKDLTTKICEQAGFQPHILFRGNYPDFINQALKNGLGISFVAEGAYLAGIARRGPASAEAVVFRPVEDEYCRRTYGLATLNSRTFPRLTRDFIAAFLQCDISQHRKALIEALFAETQP